jgi:hypothetical protein
MEMPRIIFEKVAYFPAFTYTPSGEYGRAKEIAAVSRRKLPYKF